jgi:hypothetical protein
MTKLIAAFRGFAKAPKMMRTWESIVR